MFEHYRPKCFTDDVEMVEMPSYQHQDTNFMDGFKHNATNENTKAYRGEIKKRKLHQPSGPTMHEHANRQGETIGKSNRNLVPNMSELQ